ncbi:hypothetical protein [Nocardia sp. IFM 10818]
MSGRPPTQLTEFGRQRGRGPRADRPVISAADRSQFFDNLLRVADRCRWPEDALLRRQAIYLLGFDDRAHSAEWLSAEHARALRSARDANPPGWLRVRSSAIALTAIGDREPLRAYLVRVHDDHAQELTNLTYYAYWVGELGTAVVTDDSAMVRAHPRHWPGSSCCGICSPGSGPAPNRPISTPTPSPG